MQKMYIGRAVFYVRKITLQCSNNIKSSPGGNAPQNGKYLSNYGNGDHILKESVECCKKKLLYISILCYDFHTGLTMFM